MTPITFDKDFMFGAAAASFQIEGASAEDGKVPSIWDTMCATPGKVANGDTGEVACDHYHRMPQDIAMMKDLGLSTYRFSVSWPRVMSAPGVVNEAGLKFYSRLVDELIANGMTPWLTLYHWDLPQYEQDNGGWTSRDTAYHFADYAEAVYNRLGDRVDIWTTLNEPWCSAFLGHGSGEHAPGRTEPRETLEAVHHLLLGHGLAVERLRSLGLDESKTLGITINPSTVHAADPSNPDDVAAARLHDGFRNRIFLDPLFNGFYPADVIEAAGDLWPAELIHDGDLELISQPIDVLGINFYNGEMVGGDPTADVASPGAPHPNSGQIFHVARDLPHTHMGWEIYAPDFTELLLRLHTEWTAPKGTYLAVTENGAAFDDHPDENEFVQDDDRIAYYNDHIRAVHEAIQQGADVRAYLAWSIMDNFEWAWGYDKRFGIVRVNYETQQRTPKASAHWFGQLARTHTLTQ